MLNDSGSLTKSGLNSITKPSAASCFAVEVIRFVIGGDVLAGSVNGFSQNLAVIAE